MKICALSQIFAPNIGNYIEIEEYITFFLPNDLDQAA